MKISVVIATRNRCEMLAQALTSVQAQQMADWELLVVDDASTDGTAAYLQALDCARLRVLRQDRCCERAAARNLGLEAARGAYIMFLDDDDSLHPRALQWLSRALDKYPAAIAAVGARADWFVAEHKTMRDCHVRIARRRVIFDELLLGWSAVSGQVLYRRSVVLNGGGYDGGAIPCEDRALWLKITPGKAVALCPQTVMTYRVHPGQRRPQNILQIRERVARQAIRRMPRSQRRRALRIRRSTARIDQAESSIMQGHYLRGWTAGVSAFICEPRLFASPLIWPWVARKLIGRTWHHVMGHYR